jgi:hypothetical protein
MRPMTRKVLAAGLSPEFWAALKKGRLMIPEEVLRPFIEEALAEEEEVRLIHCAFQTDGIRLEIQVEKAGTRLTLPMAITLDTISINRSEQKVEAHLAWEKPVGDNLLGRIVAGVAQGLIFKMAAGRMAGNQVATVAAMDRRHGRVIVDLSGLKPIRTFEHRLPFVGLSVLDVVGVNGVRHIDKGVALILARSGGAS